MPSRNKYWVVWNSANEQWQVTKTGNAQAIKNFSTKPPAIDYGVAIAKNNMPSQLFIKNQDGTIADERTYQDDPFPPRG